MARSGGFPFEQTTLWRKSFGGRGSSEETESRSFLRNQLMDIRRRAQQLVSLISVDIPQITVHDVSHLDALWETASLVAGRNYSLNPAEGFIFGCAVLLHDAAMSLAAYPDGMKAIQQTPQWRDVVAGLLQADCCELPSDSMIAEPPAEIVQIVLPEVLRALHAIGAEKLPLQEWRVDGGNPEYLIQDSDLRGAYGNIIGKISASHWWSPFELEKLPPRVNAAPGVPAQWHANPIKIACLLRIADAAHIDHRRAPRFLKALINPQGVARQHWEFQSKLGKPSIENGYLVYTGGPFTIDNSESWWLCHEMLVGIDRELREVRSVLEDNQLPSLIASGVSGINSPVTVARFITTERWRPVDTELRVSDVPALVSLLGGEHLYGSSPAAALRELIQNSADAIRARRLMGNLGDIRFRIRVRLRQLDNTWWLDVEDNGIGMSATVLTGALLDFGRSFWKSSDMRRQFPGLVAKGMQATGRYGIGFFSVFMLGNQVTVTSRRYDSAASDTHTLEFRGGLKLRPILREPDASEALSQSGTRISVCLRDPPNKGILRREFSNGYMSLSMAVARVCPAVDVIVETDEDGKTEHTAIQANDWLDVPGSMLFDRAMSGHTDITVSEHYSTSIRIIRDPSSNAIFGRACIFPDKHYNRSVGVLVVGGFRAMALSGIAGVLFGEPQTASRNLAMPIVPAHLLREWASEQAKLICASGLSPANKLAATSVVLTFGGDIGELPISIQDGEHLPSSELARRFKTLDIVHVYDENEIVHREDDDVTFRVFEREFTIRPDLFLVSDSAIDILKVGDVAWPQSLTGLYIGEKPLSCMDVFERILTEAWEAPPEEDADDLTVGSAGEVKIVRYLRIYRRQPVGDDTEDA